MRRWSTGTNNYYFTGSIFLEEAPWYIFFIESLIMNICHWIPRIPLPKIKIIREGEEYNLRSWYGTTGDLFHSYVCSKVSEWCWNKTKNYNINFPYEMLRELIPASEDPNPYFTDEDDKEDLKKNLEYSKSVGKEFRTVYNKLDKIYDVRSKEITKQETIKKMTDEINSDKIIGE